MKSALHHILIQTLLPLKSAFEACLSISETDWHTIISQGIKMEQPKHREHGDYAVNISFLARYTKLAPPLIATTLLPHLHIQGFTATAIGGFINFKATEASLLQTLLPTLHGIQKAGQNISKQNERLHLEFVSANPTGPLHLGHGRWAALGDSLRRIWQHNGATVVTEFLVNDYGQQMTNMANSVWFRALEYLKLAPFPTPVEGEKFLYYPGDYVTDLALEYLEEDHNAEAIRYVFEQEGAKRLEQLASKELLFELRNISRNAMLQLQQDLLKRFRTSFDIWQLESHLHLSGVVEKTLERLKSKGVTFEEDGALWIKSTEVGDDKDRVLVKSDGSYTYLTADVAYHDDKFNRAEHFTSIVNIWGADHHGYVSRITAAMQALGHEPQRLVIILGQLVNLVVEGEKTRMGKRKTMLTLEDVIEEVGVDAARFWLVSRSADSTIEFDVDLATSASDENPVFYTQYAHARACGILRNAFNKIVDLETGEESPARFNKKDYEAFKKGITAEAWETLLLKPFEENKQAYNKVRETILLLVSFTERVEDAGRVNAPHLIARYALDLSSDFHSLYAACRVLCDDPQEALARLLLVDVLRLTLAQALDLLGVTAPEQM
ncbi:MAG: arginine--tRNA ligase [Vampirovibrionales bacterium]|jgi:arginyl-tRNA synthetase